MIDCWRLRLVNLRCHDTSYEESAMMRFLSKKDVRSKIGLSFATLDRMEKDKAFPKRVQINFRVFWLEAEVEEWMRARIARRDLAD